MDKLKLVQNQKYKISNMIIGIIRAIFLLTSIYLITKGEFKDTIFLAISLIFTFSSEIYTRIFRTKIPKYMELFFVIFIFGAQFLGTFIGFYGYKYWDVLLHLSSGVLTGFIAIVLWASVDKTYLTLINRKIGLIVTYILGVGIACASIWEALEFGADVFFGMNAQLGSLNDTMQDILCGIFGTIIFSLYILFRFYKNKKSPLDEIMDINYHGNKNKE